MNRLCPEQCAFNKQYDVSKKHYCTLWLKTLELESGKYVRAAECTTRHQYVEPAGRISV